LNFFSFLADDLQALTAPVAISLRLLLRLLPASLSSRLRHLPLPPAAVCLLLFAAVRRCCLPLSAAAAVADHLKTCCCLLSAAFTLPTTCPT
jgi:hypothetical protein